MELGKYNYGVFWGFAQFINREYGIKALSDYAITLSIDLHENTVKKVFGDSEKVLLAKFVKAWPEFFSRSFVFSSWPLGIRHC